MSVFWNNSRTLPVVVVAVFLFLFFYRFRQSCTGVAVLLVIMSIRTILLYFRQQKLYDNNIYLLDSMLQSLGWTVSDLVCIVYICSSVTSLNLFERFESLLFKRDVMLFQFQFRKTGQLRFLLFVISIIDCWNNVLFIINVVAAFLLLPRSDLHPSS